ncbi:hypothetical protein ACFLQL_00505 [Verrucomicrobiota bacterium]
MPNKKEVDVAHEFMGCEEEPLTFRDVDNTDYIELEIALLQENKKNKEDREYREYLKTNNKKGK